MCRGEYFGMWVILVVGDTHQDGYRDEDEGGDEEGYGMEVKKDMGWKWR